jgi:3-phosphoshikimate 1-carboxyvinyltransferase
VTVLNTDELLLDRVRVPGDASSAAFLVAAGVLVPGSRLLIRDVGVNWSRVGFLRIVRRMRGIVLGDLEAEEGELSPDEPVSDLDVAHGALEGTLVEAEEVPLAIDELPLFALAAACARGESVLRGAEELRAKETDRIEATVDALRALGARARARDDGLAVTGVPARLRGGRISSRGDHRIAMLGAVAGLASRDGVRIEDAGAVAVSFPGFFELVDGLRRTARTRSRWDE